MSGSLCIVLTRFELRTLFERKYDLFVVQLKLVEERHRVHKGGLWLFEQKHVIMKT